MVLQLYDGHTREVSAGDPSQFRRVYFKQQVFGVPDVGNQLQRNERPDGYRGDREMTIGMLQAQIDTLERQRAEETRTLRQSLLADLDFALTGEDPTELPGRTAASGTNSRRRNQRQSPCNIRVGAFRVDAAGADPERGHVSLKLGLVSTRTRVTREVCRCTTLTWRLLP